MKIDLGNLRKYGKQISAFLEGGSMYYESVYLNFKDSDFIFSSSKGFLKLPMTFTEKDTELKNVFMNASKLIILASQFDSVDLVEDKKEGEPIYVLKNGKNKFVLRQFFEDMDYSTIFEEDFLDLKLEMTPKIFNHLIRIPSYIDSTSDGLFGAYFVNDESEGKTMVIGSNRYKFYQFYANYDTINTENSFWIDGNVLSFIRSFSDSFEKLQFAISTNKTKVSVPNEIEVAFSTIKDLEFPADVTSSEFKNNYVKNDYIDVKADTILSSIKFLDSFVKDIRDTKIKVEIEENDVTINVVADNNVETHLEVVSNFKDKAEFWVSQNVFKNAVLDILGCNSDCETIRISFDKNEPFLLRLQSIEGYDKVQHDIIFAVLV